VEAIRKAHGDAVRTEMRPGSDGIFDVQIDGELVFSKWQEYRFPANKEILDQIARRLKKA
jgi:selenoprotein W-related protein